jgi:hypothetical protein
MSWLEQLPSLSSIFARVSKRIYHPELLFDKSVLDEYVFPPTGASAEKASFLSQVGDLDVASLPPRPPPKVYDRMLDRLESFYPHSKWSIAFDFLHPSHVHRVIGEIMNSNPTKSPGSVFLRMGLSSNSAVFDRLGLEGITAMVLERVDSLLSSGPGDAKYISDPVRVFVKDEPHSLKKAAAHRWRLLWGVSLIDQIIDRLLYSEVCSASITHASLQSAKPGFSFKHGGTQRMIQKYDDQSAEWISFDASGFDLSVVGWELEAVRDLNERLCLTTGPLLNIWRRLSLAREEAAAYGSFVFTDGSLYKKLHPMWVLSGRFTTIDGNGKIMAMPRVLYDIHCGVPSDPGRFISMGDDTVQAFTLLPLADELSDHSHVTFVAFAKAHCNITLTIESELGFFTDQNFCSAEFVLDTGNNFVCSPLNLRKTSFRAAHPENPASIADTLFNLALEYAFIPDAHDFFQRALAQVDPSRVRSTSLLQKIHTGYE